MDTPHLPRILPLHAAFCISHQLERNVIHGSGTHGFGTDLWTLPRVAAVIERTTGVHYHPGHVWKILAALE